MDYEKAKEYLLTVQAIDQGYPPLSNQATVNVTVVDANDNIPTFTQMAYTAQVNESEQVGSIVLKVYKLFDICIENFRFEAEK